MVLLVGPALVSRGVDLLLPERGWTFEGVDFGEDQRRRSAISSVNVRSHWRKNRRVDEKEVQRVASFRRRLNQLRLAVDILCPMIMGLKSL